MMKAFAARLATWGQHRTSLRELSRLSDHELDDLGIGRAEIRAVASGAALTACGDVDAVVGGHRPSPILGGSAKPHAELPPHRLLRRAA